MRGSTGQRTEQFAISVTRRELAPIGPIHGTLIVIALR
jgi:hypothetical protein